MPIPIGGAIPDIRGGIPPIPIRGIGGKPGIGGGICPGVPICGGMPGICGGMPGVGRAMSGSGGGAMPMN